MELRNHSPFPPLVFQSRDVDRRDFGVIVLRGTFDLEHESSLKPSVSQEPILLVDEYEGEPGKSSMIFENNLAPYKPRADLHVRADAVAPNNIETEQWDVSARVGDVQSSLTVTGPRNWHKNVVGWKLDPIKPVSRVAITYENAFGGEQICPDGPEVYSPNPLGVGWLPEKLSRSVDKLSAPTVLPLGRSRFQFGEALPTVGFLPIPPHWDKRRLFAGTFNAAWEKNRWPDLPEDFQFEFYNSSNFPPPSELFFRGDEELEFINLHPISHFKATLPQITLQGLVRCVDGQITPSPINLDTITVDLLSEKVFLTWRGIFPVEKPIRVFEVRINFPDSLSA